MRNPLRARATVRRVFALKNQKRSICAMNLLGEFLAKIS